MNDHPIYPVLASQNCLDRVGSAIANRECGVAVTWDQMRADIRGQYTRLAKAAIDEITAMFSEQGI